MTMLTSDNNPGRAIAEQHRLQVQVLSPRHPLERQLRGFLSSLQRQSNLQPLYRRHRLPLNLSPLASVGSLYSQVTAQMMA